MQEKQFSSFAIFSIDFVWKKYALQVLPLGAHLTASNSGRLWVLTNPQKGSKTLTMACGTHEPVHMQIY